LACALVGGLATAMALIRVVLVPLWQDLPPGDFRAWFRRYGRRIGSVMIPLGATAMTTSVAAALLEPKRGSKAATAATAGVVAITLAVNEPANERFWSDDPMTDEDTTALLGRWKRWHNARVVLGVCALIAAVRRL
jgi:hypothetical protein